MKYSVYAIRDDRTESFLTPTCDLNDRTAARNFEHAVRQPNTLFYSHPQDYMLYCIGEYDERTGALVPCTPRLVIGGLDFD